MDESWFPGALRRARAGQASGFDELVGHLHGRLIGFARARGATDPEGLADEVLVQMCRSIEGFDGNLAQLRAWVFTIARNRLVDERRHASRRVDARPTEPDALPEQAATSTALEDLEQRERVDALLAELTEDQREIVVLRVIVGLSVEETAEVVGRRPGAVRALQHRAMRHLRAQLVQDGE